MATVQRPDRVRIGDTLYALRGNADHGEFPNLADALYDQMWRRIVNMEFSPGSRLSDDVLAKEFRVSRTPMREALYRLSQVGLVRVNARRGFFVPTVYREDAVEVYDLRTALETFATRIATPLLTDADLAPHMERQRRVHEHASSDAPADAEDFVHSDLLLHDMLIQRTGNHRMQQTLANLRGQLSVVHLRMAQVPELNLRAVEEHGQILDALIARDAGTAAQAMEAHLHGVKRRVLTNLDLPSRPNRN